MNKILLLFITLILFSGCKKEFDLKPKYVGNNTDWEVRGLFGKVKEVRQFKANFKGSDGTQKEKPILNLNEQFERFGSVKMSKYFDPFGEPLQTIKYFHDGSNLLKKVITIGQNTSQKSIETILNDTINKITTRNITYNDSLNFKFIFQYDNSERINTQTKIQNRDTLISNFEYVYDDANNLLKSVESIIGEENGVVNEYKYDDNGNVIETITGPEYYKLKTIKEYKDNILTASNHYTISQDLKEHLNEIIEYDKISNVISEKIFEDGKLNRELKKEYEFDDYGNWIERKVYFKEHFANSKKFVPVYVETRKIKYWE
ncbi:hypothetical protein SAMN04488008_1171 [Maribacter orientalis]|uniref:YD repeat-containing protein n=1 Tax=Maribacter orientalis TaxID=228957 RepID=A0A1H7XFB6_9FLAO|nr:hypothetical protein [Maribacter orientalis]SEM32365.1 hypothetical protein SAMN04488008_1171 [Maribacter orientalis]